MVPETNVVPLFRVCKKCGLEKPAHLYFKRKARRAGFHSACKECFNEARRERKRQSRPPRVTIRHESALSENSTRTCGACRITKPIAEFWKCVNSTGGRATTCIPCSKKRGAKYIDANREKVVRRAVASNRKRLYGVTSAAFEALKEAQGHKCAICRNLFAASTRKVHIDHDHNIGDVRGLLCSNCNTGLGLFRDNTENLNSAIAYLNRARGVDR